MWDVKRDVVLQNTTVFLGTLKHNVIDKFEEPARMAESQQGWQLGRPHSHPHPEDKFCVVSLESWRLTLLVGQD